MKWNATLAAAVEAPVAVVTNSEVIMIRVQAHERQMSYSFFSHVLATIDECGHSTDLVCTGQTSICLAVSARGLDAVRSLEQTRQRLRRHGHVTMLSGVSMLSVAGPDVTSTECIAGLLFSVLSDDGVQVEMISQGAGQMSVSCVIPTAATDRAVKVLRARLLGLMDPMGTGLK